MASKKLRDAIRFLFAPGGLNYCRIACSADQRGPCGRCQRPELQPNNATALELFLAALTQLRHAWAGPTGLDYQGLLATAQCMAIPMTPALFRLIRVCESEYLAVLAEHRPKS